MLIDEMNSLTFLFFFNFMSFSLGLHVIDR